MLRLIVLLSTLSVEIKTANANMDAIKTSADYTCWTCYGPFERHCFHAEPLKISPYPLSEEMLERSIPYRTSEASMHGLFQSARYSRKLKVLVIGGSVTFGHECVSPSNLRDKLCSWPHRLQQWCDQRIQEFKCEVGTNFNLNGGKFLPS